MALFGRKRKSSPARTIYVNESLPADYVDKKGKVKKEFVYPTNQVVTSKYTIVTFLPRNLLEQFRRVANCFFLAINILQFFPKFSTISPGLVILPLLAVLAITALKDGYEDIKRHQADRKVNHGIVHVLKGKDYVNNNAMGTKSKTFVPGIPLPRFKSKKAKSKEQEDKEIAQGAVGEASRGAQPHEQNQEALRRMQSQVSTWHDDPEAGDAPGELGWHRTKWEDICVGDFVKIYDNEQFPAGKSAVLVVFAV
jgi:phospholipid-translocating ATPase